MSKIVVTGAASHLGSFAVRYLRSHANCDIVAVTSGRTHPDATMQVPGVQWRSGDLRSPLREPLRSEISAADRVLHFAWTRDGSETEVRAANEAMIRNISDPLADRSRLWFISSVSASPTPFSTYGKTKFECSRLVTSLGGSTLVCGLVVEEHPAKGPYRMLRNVVGKLPFSLRAGSGEPLVFPIRMDDMGRTLGRVAGSALPSGTYRMFSTPVRFNQFIALLEQLRPRARVPLRFSAGLVIRGAAAAKRSRVLPVKICDQVMTFLYKDESHLLGHKELPGVPLRCCSDRSYFVGT